MTKLEAWKAWNEAVGVGMEATEYALEKSSHGKAFSYAWDAAVKAEREKVAAWMRSKSYATGHGDTTEDLLKELEWQVAEREREACAVVCERLPETFKIAADEFGYEAEIPTAENYAAAIRTRSDE
jgi:hypothetical protein